MATTMTEPSAVFVADSHCGGFATPRAISTWFKGPWVGLKIMAQTIPTATIELMLGRKNMVLKRLLPLIPLLTPTAKSSANTMVPGTVTRV